MSNMIQGCAALVVVQVLVVGVLLATCGAFARERDYGVMGERLSQHDQHVLARTLIGEADGSVPDWRGIAWVLLKRWRLHKEVTEDPVSYGDFAKRYSALWRNQHPRARNIRNLPWMPTDSNRWGGKRWDRARDWVDRWARGLVPDPCHTAWHWGGPMDRPQPYWYPVNCGNTKNIFYAVR